MTTATFDKSIRYDRATGDFAAHLNGELIGYFGNYSDAENALDQVAYDQLADGVALTATELDGGSDADAMAEEARAAVEAVFICAACDTSEYEPSLMQPAFCFACVQAMLAGKASRLDGQQPTPAAVEAASECEAYGCRERVTHEQISDRPWTDYAFCCYHFRMNVNGGTCNCDLAPVITPAADVLTGSEASTLLDAINTAHRNGLDTTGTRAWLAGYGYKTKLSAMTGAWVPDGGGHGWKFVTGRLVLAAA